MDKIEYRAVIKFHVKAGLTPNEIHSKFIKVYGDSSPLFSTFKKWAAEFKRGSTSLEDDPHEGRPKSATTPEIIEQVHDMVLDDRRMKVREIAETIRIASNTKNIYFLLSFCGQADKILYSLKAGIFNYDAYFASRSMEY
jgi:transposase